MQIVFEDAQLHPDRLSDEISHGLNFLELGPNLLHLTTSHRPGCIEWYKTCMTPPNWSLIWYCTFVTNSVAWLTRCLRDQLPWHMTWMCITASSRACQQRQHRILQQPPFRIAFTHLTYALHWLMTLCHTCHLQAIILLQLRLSGLLRMTTTLVLTMRVPSFGNKAIIWWVLLTKPSRVSFITHLLVQQLSHFIN
jgi:hypothetical protein